MKTRCIMLLLAFLSIDIFAEQILKHSDLYLYPYEESPIVGSVDNGDDVEVLSVADIVTSIGGIEYYWYCIRFEDNVGWIFSDSLEKDVKSNIISEFDGKSLSSLFFYNLDKNGLKGRFGYVDPAMNQKIALDVINRVAVYFDPIENYNDGFRQYKDLIVLFSDGSAKRISGVETGIHDMESEFITLSPNGKFVVVDMGTGFERAEVVISLETGENVFVGHSLPQIQYDGGFLVKSIKHVRTEYQKDQAIKFAAVNNGNPLGFDVGDDVTDYLKRKIEFDCFRFGYLQTFNTLTGETKNSKIGIYSFIEQ